MTRVIGLISGTSVDGIDAALVEISGTDIDLQVELVAGVTYPYPDSLREKILAVCAGVSLSMAELAELDDAIAFQFAQAAQEIQRNSPTANLIGSHGQTVYHRPPVKSGSQQTVEPLPTSPSSHHPITQLGYTQHRCIQNIGGIGNLTYLPARQGNWLEAICGWDTGPGNALLDLAVQHFSDGSQTYDQDGNWARQGTPCQELVEQWLREDFFHLSPPKSTGRELFGVDYLNRCLAESSAYHLSPADTLATLTELTATSIVHSYRNFLPKMPDEVLLCGGGSRNLYLKQRLLCCSSLLAHSRYPW
jgi:anhydro-N-acetylmuramic acid kinase